LSTDQSAMSLLYKPNTRQELLSDWLIYLSVLHVMGWSKINKRLLDMTPNQMLLDVCVEPE